MGGFVTKVLSSLSQGKEKRILMLGMDAAGKTTILYQMKIGENIQSVPTIGFNVEQVQYKNIKFTIWDIGGQWKLRQLWHHYFAGSDALIYVVDSTDVERISEAKDSLKLILSCDEMKDIPLLVLANKQDIALMSSSEITSQLELRQIKGNRSWFVQDCSALSGDGLYDGLDWLSKELKNIN